jgi:hypothetical protein
LLTVGWSFLGRIFLWSVHGRGQASWITFLRSLLHKLDTQPIRCARACGGVCLILWNWFLGVLIWLYRFVNSSLEDGITTYVWGADLGFVPDQPPSCWAFGQILLISILVGGEGANYILLVCSLTGCAGRCCSGATCVGLEIGTRGAFWHDSLMNRSEGRIKIGSGSLNAPRIWLRIIWRYQNGAPDPASCSSPAIHF